MKGIFRETKFDLHKWHSNEAKLEENSEATPVTQNGKENMEGINFSVKPGETKMQVKSVKNQTASISLPIVLSLIHSRFNSSGCLWKLIRVSLI